MLNPKLLKSRVSWPLLLLSLLVLSSTIALSGPIKSIEFQVDRLPSGWTSKTKLKAPIKYVILAGPDGAALNIECSPSSPMITSKRGKPFRAMGSTGRLIHDKKQARILVQLATVKGPKPPIYSFAGIQFDYKVEPEDAEKQLRTLLSGVKVVKSK